MDYKEMCDLVESLGWKYRTTWTNRAIYNIGPFRLVEHNCSWSIAKDDDLYYIEDADENIIREYTDIVTKIVCDVRNSGSISECLADISNLDEFYEKYNDYYPEEEFFD